MSNYEVGSELPELKVTPDAFLTYRYAGASGDFNPIHLSDDFAKAVGFPSRILHGLYSMAQVARAQTDAAGGPEKLKSLKGQFRGIGLPEQEITVRSKVIEIVGDRAVIETEAEQSGQAIIRNATAEIQL